MNKDAVIAGQAVYSKRVLSLYDILVLGISNHLIWKCPTKHISQLFIDNVSNNHLDIGVGTGYYLKKHLPASTQRIAIMDLNENSLGSTAAAIAQFNPEIYRKNVLEPFNLTYATFDSVSINYLLHYVPGDLNEKSVIFAHAKDMMNSGGVFFGSTILGEGLPKSGLAKKLMGVYNQKGIFCNHKDSLADLQKTLSEHFVDVSITVKGCVALFSAKKP